MSSDTVLLSQMPGISTGLQVLASSDSDLNHALHNHGPLQFTLKPGGFGGMIRIILGQQVSVLAADAMWQKLQCAMPAGVRPETIVSLDDTMLRSCGFSRQKSRYARCLADDVLSGRLNLHELPADDEAAIGSITRSIGLGRWTAENYLIFCEGRANIFPAKDLAILIGLQRLKQLPIRPTAIEAWNHAEQWRPHRTAASLLIWHQYIATTAQQRGNRELP